MIGGRERRVVDGYVIRSISILRFIFRQRPELGESGKERCTQWRREVNTRKRKWFSVVVIFVYEVVNMICNYRPRQSNVNHLIIPDAMWVCGWC